MLKELWIRLLIELSYYDSIVLYPPIQTIHRPYILLPKYMIASFSNTVLRTYAHLHASGVRIAPQASGAFCVWSQSQQR